MSKSKKESYDKESKISSHKHIKNKLIPPLLQIPKLTPSPWIHDRLPEMIWAALIVGNTERKKALDVFRSIGKYVSTNQKYYDVTLTGIGKLTPSEIKTFLNHLLNWSEEMPVVLRPLRLYPEIPASDIFNDLLEDPVPKEDWKKISESIRKTFDHQSQEATDCKWIKVLCFMLGGKLKFQKNMEETVKEIIEYPNYGDLRKVRPTIRALEISLQNKDLTWPTYFWRHNYISTDCIPEEAFSEKIKSRQVELSQEMQNMRKHLIDETKRIRDDIITYFFESVDDTRVDTRRETSFGLTLFGLTFFTEIVLYNISCSITGRIALRSLIEVYITFKYLLKKEQEESEIWDDFHNYGTGQSKLIYLKLKVISKQSRCIELNELNKIVNEDQWVEFTPINLGQWGKSDLRTMSIYANVKDIYDRYYNYTSGFVHGNKGALRESVYQMCLNPLHRFHRIPLFDLTLMPSVTLDSVEIVNEILNCLNTAYPPFNSRIKLPKLKRRKQTTANRSS